MPTTLMGSIHMLVAVAALVVGAAVSLARKGTARHRRLGQVYVWLMLAVNGTAFTLYGLLGHFGPFHVAALFSLLTIVVGWWPARRRTSPRWVERHAYFMAGSYVGLLAALAAETLARWPSAPFWGTVIAATVGTTAVGVVVMRRRIPAALAPFTSGRMTSR